MEQLKKYEEMNIFNEKQLYEIKLGLEDNLDVSIYANSEFDDIEMLHIRKTLLRRFNPKDLIGKVEFKCLPLIAEINNLGLDINKYINKNEDFLNEIINKTLDKKIEEFINSKGYNINDFNEDIIFIIRRPILKGLNIYPYINPKFNYACMIKIIEGLEDNLDVSIYAKEYFNFLQMNEILEGLKENINASLYANPEITWGQMERIRIALEKGTFCRKDYFDTKIIDGKITYIPKNF